MGVNRDTRYMELDELTSHPGLAILATASNEGFVQQVFTVKPGTSAYPSGCRMRIHSLTGGRDHGFHFISTFSG
jgi:hypothetical protein